MGVGFLFVLALIQMEEVSQNPPEAVLHRGAVVLDPGEPKPEPFLSLVLQMESSSFWRSPGSPVYPVLGRHRTSLLSTNA